MKFDLKRLWPVFGLTLLVWVIALGISVIWPMTPYHWDPASLDGKGPRDLSKYLCQTRNGPRECSALQFWPMVLLLSPFALMFIQVSILQSVLMLTGVFAVMWIVDSYARKWRWLVVIASIPLLAFVMSWFNYPSLYPTAKTSPSVTTSAPSSAFTAAAALLPPGKEVTQSARMNDDLYWFATKTFLANAENSSQYQFWVVNSRTGTVNLVQDRTTNIPSVRLSTEPNANLYGYFVIRTEQGWEGYNEEYLDVIDLKSAKRFATIAYQNIVPKISTELVGGLNHVITLAPENPCADLKEDRNVSVSGILVDGTLIKLAKPQSVHCSYSELMGQAVASDFTDFSFSRTLEPAQTLGLFRLPWGKTATIDLTKTKPSQVVNFTE